MLTQLTLSQVDAYKTVNYNTAITQAWLSTIGTTPVYATIPPSTPVTGKWYLVGNGASGAFNGGGGKMATYFLNPSTGLLTPDFITPAVGENIAGYVKTANNWVLLPPQTVTIFTDVDLDLDLVPAGVFYFIKSAGTSYAIDFNTNTLRKGTVLRTSPFVPPIGLTVLCKVGLDCYTA